MGRDGQVHPADNDTSEAFSQENPEKGPKNTRILDLQKELQMYMNAINAILVGAAVIVGVTFQGFLQAPDDPSFILDFCLYNSLSFYSAVATMIAGAGAALPSSGSPLDIEEEVKSVRMWVRASSVLLAVSIVCVLGAVPGPHYGNPPNLRRNPAITTIHCVGLFICAAAMTAYVLRLNWKFVHNLGEDILQQVKALVIRTKQPGMEAPTLRRVVIVVALCCLIYSFFLAFLFFLPFYGKFKGEWAPSPTGAPSPGPGR